MSIVSFTYSSSIFYVYFPIHEVKTLLRREINIKTTNYLTMSDNFRIDIFLVLENKGKLTRTMLSRQKKVLHSTFEAGFNNAYQRTCVHVRVRKNNEA